MRRFLLLAAALVCLLLPGGAAAAGGNYVFAGGTSRQQAEVRAALDASAFDFSLVPAQITIHIKHGVVSQSQPGHVWLDARLLGAGRFAWATVQDEYAHQVDFFLLDDAARALLLGHLGGKDWCYSAGGLAHSDYGCERFSSVFAWAYWPSRDNAYRPRSARDEAAAMPPAKFRALLGALVGFADPLARGAAAARQPLTSRRP